jgi:Tfp pilus assembly protein PilX
VEQMMGRFLKKALLTIKNAEVVRGSDLWKDEQGATLVTALLAMLVLSSVGMMITVTVAEEAQVALNHYETVGCLYICEAGLNYAVVKLQTSSSWAGLPSPGVNIGGGNYTVAVSDTTSVGTPLAAGQKRLNVVATLGATEREIEVIVQ